MAEANLSKFNSAMSQFQSGEDGINNYLSKRGGDIASTASSSIADSIGISQEDKEAAEEAIGLVAGAAPILVAGGTALFNRATGKTAAKAASKAAAKAAGKDGAAAGGKAAAKAAGKDAAADAGSTAAKTGGDAAADAGSAAAKTGGDAASDAADAANLTAEPVDGSVGLLPQEMGDASEFASSDVLTPYESGAPPSAGPGQGAGDAAEGGAEGGAEAGAEGGDDILTSYGVGGADEYGASAEGGAAGAEEGGAAAGEAGEAGAGAAEAGAAGAAEAGAGAAEAGASGIASLFTLEGAAAAVPVLGEVAMVAGAGYAIYEGIKDFFGGASTHTSAVRAAFSGDTAISGVSTSLTAGNFAVASADGVTTTPSGSGSF